jgi:hypothetical protein
MIKIERCSVTRVERDEDFCRGSDSFARRSPDETYKATLDLVMDKEGRERLATILATQFGTAPVRPGPSNGVEAGPAIAERVTPPKQLPPRGSSKR